MRRWHSRAAMAYDRDRRGGPAGPERLPEQRQGLDLARGLMRRRRRRRRPLRPPPPELPEPRSSRSRRRHPRAQAGGEVVDHRRRHVLHDPGAHLGDAAGDHQVGRDRRPRAAVAVLGDGQPQRGLRRPLAALLAGPHAHGGRPGRVVALDHVDGAAVAHPDRPHLDGDRRLEAAVLGVSADRGPGQAPGDAAHVHQGREDVVGRRRGRELVRELHPLPRQRGFEGPAHQHLRQVRPILARGRRVGRRVEPVGGMLRRLGGVRSPRTPPRPPSPAPASTPRRSARSGPTSRRRPPPRRRSPSPAHAG